VSATTPIILITTEVSSIIIATISAAEIRKLHEVGAVDKKNYASRKGKLSHVRIVCMFFKQYPITRGDTGPERARQLYISQIRVHLIV
jgi:hypothetical protein